jgi:hypothetical protein
MECFSIPEPSFIVVFVYENKNNLIASLFYGLSFILSFLLFLFLCYCLSLMKLLAICCSFCVVCVVSE